MVYNYHCVGEMVCLPIWYASCVAFSVALLQGGAQRLSAVGSTDIHLLHMDGTSLVGHHISFAAGTVPALVYVVTLYMYIYTL